MNFKALFLSSCAVVFSGCQAPMVLEPESQQSTVAEQVAQLDAVAVSLPSQTQVKITPASQQLQNNEIASPVALFEIPANRGQMRLIVTSHIKQDVFFPHLMIVDAQGEVIERYENVFEYQKPRLNLGNRLVAEVEFFPPNNLKTAYVLVYTTAHDLNGVTYVAHPARIDAEGRGNHFPEAKDIAVAHSRYGVIELELSGPSFLSQLTTRNTSPKAISSDEAKTQAREVQPDTQAYYQLVITQAVESGNLNKALALLDEAKALGVVGAQEIFVQAVNKK